MTSERIVWQKYSSDRLWLCVIVSRDCRLYLDFVTGSPTWAWQWGLMVGCSVLQTCNCHNSTNITTPVLLESPHERGLHIKDCWNMICWRTASGANKKDLKVLNWHKDLFLFFQKNWGVAYNLIKPQITPTLHFTEYNAAVL